MAKLEDIQLLDLDYEEKIRVLGQVAQELLNLRMEYARVSGRHAELRANITVLREVKSALQSAIKAET